MQRLLISVVSVVGIVCCLLGPAFRVASAQTAGRTPAPGEPSSGGVTLIDVDSPVTRTGELRVWRAYSRDGARVILKIYRMENDRLVLVGASALETVPPGQVAIFTCLIPVARGDRIGCYCPDANCVDRFSDGSALRVDGDMGTTLTSELVTETGTPAIFASGTLAVDIPTNADTEVVLPVVARTAGFEGTQWITSLELFNTRTTTVEATLFFNLADRDNIAPFATARVQLPARGTVVLEDLLMDVFELDEVSGSLDVVASGPIIAHARIANVGGGIGTYGQLVPGLPASWATGDDDAPGFNAEADNVYLFEVRENDTWRTNLGIANISLEPLTVVVRAFASTGVVGATLRVDLEPVSQTQISRILDRIQVPGDLPGLRLQVSAAEGSPGRFFAYASRVDNRTGDAVFLPGARESALP